MNAVIIASIGGNCPVQAEGTIAGRPFYFRSRGNHWSLGVGSDPVAGNEFYHEEPFGDEPYAAGWMSEEEARIFIERAAQVYLNHIGQAEIPAASDDGQPSEMDEWRDYDPDC